MGYKLLHDNLQRAVRLVHNFKSLSIHNNADELQIFAMKSLLDSFSNVYINRFSDLGMQYNVDVQNELILTSYQSVLTDVLIQLIQNSLTHAFEETLSPCINIKAVRHDDVVEINYSDNGKGCVNIDKIFDLFYTTKRGADCIGLGLPIVYNQVVHKLSGSIICIPSEHGSLQFFIRVPLTLLASNE
jgi:C4-dicarboxylate-specific signal transduction histidine kinase